MNITRGNRLTSWMGLEGKYTFPKHSERNYGYVEIPFRAEPFRNGEGEYQPQGARQQYLEVFPDCSVNVRGHCRIFVQPNPALAKFGPLQGGYYIESQSGTVIPTFFISLRKDLDPSLFEYAVRLYLQES